MADDPREIYLQPECCADPEVGRLWCEDDEPQRCDEGVPWTKYVIAEEYERLRAELAANRGDLILEAQRAIDAEAERDRLRELLREVRGLFALAEEWGQRVDTKAEYPKDLLVRIDAALGEAKSKEGVGDKCENESGHQTALHYIVLDSTMGKAKSKDGR